MTVCSFADGSQLETPESPLSSRFFSILGTVSSALLCLEFIGRKAASTLGKPEMKGTIGGGELRKTSKHWHSMASF